MNIPLDQDFMAKREEAQSIVFAFEQQIADRITFILDTIYDLFGEGETNWWFPEAEENSSGNFDESVDDDYVFIHADNYVSNLKVKLANGKYVQLNDKIPLHWLFNPFEDELKEAKLRLENEIVEKSRKSAEKKANRKERELEQSKLREHQKDILKAIENKLSPEELAVLRMKIKVS